MNDLVIKNGKVLDPISGVSGAYTIVVKDGEIHSMQKGNGRTPAGANVIDAKGMYVTPGFVDIHTHLREPGYEYKEDINSGTKAAVAGGFTTICCMPNTKPVCDNQSVIEHIIDKARVIGRCRVLPIGAISKDLKGTEMADIGDLASAGALAITDDGNSVMNSLLMRRAAEYAKTFGLSVMDHCEDVTLSGDGVMNEGAVSTELGLSGIPAEAEEIQVARDILLAKLTGTHFHITHVSTAASLELIRQAKKKGINVTCDVTPHHISLTEDAVRGYSTDTKMKPPLRSAADVKALIRGLNDGTVDAIASDHAPHAIIDKELGYDSAAFGVVGLETTLPVALKLVHEDKLSLKRAVELLTGGLNSLNPAGGLGGLKRGSIADIVVFDPNAKVTIDASKFYSKGKNTPFNGWKLKGKVLYTIFGGKVVFDHEKGVSGPSGW